MKKPHPLPTLHQLRGKYTRTGIVWLFLMYGILYRELFTDETLLWCILITRGFFFFDSRWFALFA